MCFHTIREYHVLSTKKRERGRIKSTASVNIKIEVVGTSVVRTFLFVPMFVLVVQLVRSGVVICNIDCLFQWECVILLWLCLFWRFSYLNSMKWVTNNSLNTMWKEGWGVMVMVMVIIIIIKRIFTSYLWISRKIFIWYSLRTCRSSTESSLKSNSSCPFNNITFRWMFVIFRCNVCSTSNICEINVHDDVRRRIVRVRWWEREWMWMKVHCNGKSVVSLLLSVLAILRDYLIFYQNDKWRLRQ